MTALVKAGEMVLCATVDCGTPGRPFPQCDYCKQRRYCGSHCLVAVTAELIEVVRNRKASDDASPINEESLEKLRNCLVICPPCLERFQKERNDTSEGEGMKESS